MARKKQKIVDGTGRRYAVTGYRPFINEVIVEPEGPASSASAADRRPASGRRTPGAPSPGRSSSSGQPAQPRRTSTQRGTPRATSARRPNRDQALRAAIADGRLVESDLPAWRSGWDRDPTGTARALANVPVGSGRAAEEQRSGAAGQQRTARASGPSSSGPGTPGGALGRAGLRPTHLGHETRANSAGELCVLAPSGWLTVAAAERAGITESDLRSAQALRSVSGSSRTARLYREGPR